MTIQEQVSSNNSLPIKELTTNSSCIKKPKGTLITNENDDIVRFNGYYALNIIRKKVWPCARIFFFILVISKNISVTLPVYL